MKKNAATTVAQTLQTSIKTNNRDSHFGGSATKDYFELSEIGKCPITGKRNSDKLGGPALPQRDQSPIQQPNTTRLSKRKQ